ncbi:MAG: hypothetical protein ACXVEF_07410 [Polyangiales bacterium]
MTAPAQGEPPPDGGPALFTASFLVIPVGGCAALVRAASAPQRPQVALAATIVVASMLVGATWVYFSRTWPHLLLKAFAVGALALFMLLVHLKMSTSDIQGDDVLPLFFVFVGPLLVMGGGFLGVLSGAAVLVAFSLRQRARVAWLRAVMSIGHEHYGVVPLKQADQRAPLFLRYRAADLALCSYRPPTDYREPVAAEIVARVPRLF